MRITITVPGNTDAGYYEDICKGFRKKYGEDTEFIKKTSDSLIGGFIAEANRIVYDTSVRAKLDEIRKAIKG